MYTIQEQTTETAILVGVITPDDSRWVVRDNLDELAHLAQTAGATVADRVTQSLTRINPTTYIGSGKARELQALVEKHDADLVIFDDDLAPVQVRNLEKLINCKLVDRSGLILDIFASRAQTSASKTQVELAQLQYMRSRLTRMWTHLSRQKGGIGTKGPGETQIETDRRLIGQRIATLRGKLGKIDQQRTTQRKGRSQHTRVSLVGYTNAGKSTLMNAIAEAGVLAENRLFATLDATTRLVTLVENKEVLLSDTVGFIRKLPHGLVESFKSTLDEVRESDLLVHVVDVTHPRFEDHMRVVDETLRELKAADKPTLVVFNKIDGLEDPALLHALRREHPDAAFVSALRGIGLDAMKEDLLALVERDFVERETLVPVTEPQLISRIHRLADVLAESYGYARNGDPEATPTAVAHLRFRLARRHATRLAPVLDRFAGLTLLSDDEQQTSAYA